MMMSSLSASTIRGSWRIARATLVSGPIATRVISPGAAKIFSIRKSTAC